MQTLTNRSLDALVASHPCESGLVNDDDFPPNAANLSSGARLHTSLVVCPYRRRADGSTSICVDRFRDLLKGVYSYALHRWFCYRVLDLVNQSS